MASFRLGRWIRAENAVVDLEEEEEAKASMEKRMKERVKERKSGREHISVVVMIHGRGLFG